MYPEATIDKPLAKQFCLPSLAPSLVFDDFRTGALLGFQSCTGSAGLPGSRECRVAAAVGLLPADANPATDRQSRPFVLGAGQAFLERLAVVAGDRTAGNRLPLASAGVSDFLAVEVAAPGKAAD